MYGTTSANSMMSNHLNVLSMKKRLVELSMNDSPSSNPPTLYGMTYARSSPIE